MTSLDALVTTIHEAGQGQVPWADALRRLSAETGSALASYQAFEPRTDRVAHLLSFLSEPDEGVVAAYEAFTAERGDPRVEYLGGRPDGFVASDLDFLSEAEMDRHPYYQEWLPTVGTRYALLATSNTPSFWGGFALHRTRRQGPPTAAHRRLVRRLLPHLRLAARTTTLRFELERQRATIDALLASHGDALFLLDANGAFRDCNPAARPLLEARRWLQLREGRLLPVDPAARAPWSAAMARLARFGAAGLDRPLRLHGRDELRSLLVEPLPAGAPAPSMAPAPGLILRAWPEPLPPGEALRRRFGLTPREVELCLALAAGRTPEEIARASHRSPQTVKTQLRSIYRKTGVGRLQRLLTLLHELGDH